MIQVTVDTEQLKRYLTDVQRKALPGGISRALKKSAKAVEEEVKPLTPVNLGDLKRNIKSSATKTEARVGVRGTPRKYAPYVEFGTRPHWPPLEPILRWVTQKARGKGFRGAFGIQRRGQKRQAQLYAAARGVQAAIAKHGTKGAHMFERGLEAALPAIKTIFRMEIERAIHEAKNRKAAQ